MVLQVWVAFQGMVMSGTWEIWALLLTLLRAPPAVLALVSSALLASIYNEMYFPQGSVLSD